jgi:hypothetical protein
MAWMTVTVTTWMEVTVRMKTAPSHLRMEMTVRMKTVFRHHNPNPNSNSFLERS